MVKKKHKTKMAVKKRKVKMKLGADVPVIPVETVG